MRFMVVIAAAFASVFVIVGLTTSILESWASARRSAETAYLMSDQRAAERAATPTALSR